MTVSELYEKLDQPSFQDTASGDMFYNFFVFQYPAKDEYDIRHQIQTVKENLKRPTNYIDTLTLDLFDEFCKFLDGQSFGKQNPSLMKFLMGMEKNSPDNIQKVLCQQANSQKFYEYIHQRVMDHISIIDEMKRPYVFVYGIGDMFPYLRTNVFLTNYEKYNETSRYKIIVFYPGERVGNTFKLFNVLEDAHTYRAHILLNENNE